MSRLHLAVVGIGHDGPAGLSSEARSHITRASILAGGRRHLEFFSDFRGERVVLEGDVSTFMEKVRKNYREKKTVVLASGDPLFYGIGRVLLEALPREDLLFLPQVSSVQLAFARIKETWQDAKVVSLHGRPLESLLPAIEAGEKKIAILTDARNNPAAIADLLLRLDAADRYLMWICENLGGPDERVSRFPANSLNDEEFSPLNVVVLLRDGEDAATERTDVPLLGIPEEAIHHRAGPHGMITRREVRLAALCYLELHANDILWDVGAGSGSVSLEAARLGAKLSVFAIERDAEAYQRLTDNVAQFVPGRVRAVCAEAPEEFAELPDPDAVFIGGSGGRLVEILQAVAQRLRPGGRIVVNCITLETFTRGWECLHVLGLSPEATSIQLAHSRPLGRLHSLQPENPIFILRARKP